MPVNKIIFRAEVLLDLTADTVTSETLMQGVTAHDKSGNIITGTGDFVSESSVLEAEY